MKDIFVSYRRLDSSNEAGRIFDHLLNRFGEHRLFKDVDSIPLGRDFRETIASAVGQCKVLLAIVGDDWLEAADETGQRRLDNPNDYVRIEIASALQRRIPVIPVLVENASMPQEDDLPTELREFAFMNATAVRTDPDFRPDMERLLKQLDEYVQPTNSRSVMPAEEKASLRQRIENNLTIVLLTFLLSGFLAGVGTYKSVLEMAGLKTVSKDARVASNTDVVLSQSEHRALIDSASSSESVDATVSPTPYLHIIGVKIADLGALEPRASDDSSSTATPRVRVIIHTGQDTFSYPKNDLWELVDDRMRSSSFNVADGPVRIEVLLTVDGRRIDRLNNNLMVTTSIGTRGMAEVAGTLFRSRATVEYEIRSDP